MREASALASRTCPSAPTTIRALGAASNTRRVSSASGEAAGLRLSISTSAAEEPITWPRPSRIGMAVTETSSFRLVPGWAMTCWKPLTVWPRRARAFGSSSGGIWRPSG